MKRVRQLVAEIVAAHPKDPFFASFDESIRLEPLKLSHYRAYENAFRYLDEASWQVLKNKALQHFTNHRPGQLKQGLFDQLNDAFAYRFLVRRGYRDVRVIAENGRKIPDISYRASAGQKHCEVKTIGISDAQIAQRAALKAFDGSQYSALSAEFMAKLDATVTAALSQIDSQGTGGMVFVLAHFDDFTLDYYREYRRQIGAFLTQHAAPEVFVKFGYIGRRSIYKQPAHGRA